MKITIYTITDCKFSQAEKQYLQSKQIQFEEKNLESNRDFLTEMLNISNNFAGTPVTKIEKDDGQIIVLKGFTQEEFDKALAIDPNAPKQAPMPVQQDMQTQPQSPPPAAAAPVPQDPMAMQSAPVASQSAPQQPDMMPQQPPMPQQQPMTAPVPDMQQPMSPSPTPMDQQNMMNMQPAPQPMQQPDMMQQPPMPPQQAMPQDPMMNAAPPQPPAPPAEDQALNSVLQNLQSRAGDTAQ